MQVEGEIIKVSDKRKARKEYQKERRLELIELVKFNRVELQKKFGDRMNGYGKCPKVSRKEIKAFLGITD